MIPDEAEIWHAQIISVRTGDPLADAIYNMERASRDYAFPIRYTIGNAK